MYSVTTSNDCRSARVLIGVRRCAAQVPAPPWFKAAGAAAITCEGDAVQCSMAREQYKRQCEFFEKTSDETTVAGQAKVDGVEGGADHPGKNASTQALGTFDQTDIIGGACPADRVLGAGVIGVTIPFSQLCSPAEKLGILLVAWTAVACLGIVFKGT